MPTSPNGWPVSPDPSELGIVPLRVGNTDFAPGVRGGKVHDVLLYVATQVQNRVQRANATYGCWGYSYRENVNSPGDWSNHASGTAIDFNATLHPNAQPTAANWTPAQIAEIHKILDEVDNVVRWGGDYQFTPDAMHFEIDVTPEELEGRSFPKAGLVLPIGAPEYYVAPEKVPELTPMSVAYPTMSIYVGGSAYWAFKPTQSGRISIDALLSHFVDEDERAEQPGGPPVTLYVYRANVVNGRYNLLGYPPNSRAWNGRLDPSSSYDGRLLDGPPARNQGRVILEAVAGETYIIATAASAEFPWVRMVVRIGDWAVEPAWEQPPDQTTEWVAQTGGNRTKPADLYTRHVVPERGGWQGGGVDFDRSFYNPAPGLSQDAINCLWHWARRVYYNASFWWAPDNNNNNEGPGTCPNLSGLIDVINTHNFNAAGFWYSSSDYETFWGYQEITFRTYTFQQLVYPHRLSRTLGKGGTGRNQEASAPYYPVLTQDEWVEWESSYNEIVGAWWSWDEVNGGGTHHDGNLVLKWYMGDCTEIAQNQISGSWGPRPVVEEDLSTSAGFENTLIVRGVTWYGQGVATPESFLASQQHLGDTTGGYSNWAPIPQDLWHVPILFSCVPADLLNDAPPPGAVPGIPLYKENYREGLYIAVKLTVRPSRFKVYRDPGIPKLPWAGVNAINVTPDGQGKVLY